MEVQVREVWAHNVEEEFRHIRSVIDDFPFISMDTEFPGVIHKKTHTQTYTPAQNYHILKRNVDVMSIIQLGLTLADSTGNFPSLGSDRFSYIWQFNFNDFNVYRDRHSPSSIEMLRNSGIDLERHVDEGVDSWSFTELMMSSGLVCNENVVWVTFHGAYDFGYVVKMLTQRPLPPELTEFARLIRLYLGEKVFDVKYMLEDLKKSHGFYGGLNRVASQLKIERPVGQAHQAGSDSVLTWLVFQRIRDVYFQPNGGIDQYAGRGFGLVINS